MATTVMKQLHILHQKWLLTQQPVCIICADHELNKLLQIKIKPDDEN